MTGSKATPGSKGSNSSAASPEAPKIGAVEGLSELLGRPAALLFGAESASVAAWMFVILALRSALAAAGLLGAVPHALVFTLPAAMQLADSVVPFLGDCLPLLPLRITEMVMGRLKSSKLAIVIPSHFIGCILGAVLFKTLLPIAPAEALAPVSSVQQSLVTRLALDSTVVFVFNVVVIALPELLAANRLSRYYLSLPIVVLILGLSVGAGFGLGSSLSPAADCALLRLQNQASLDDVLIQLENLGGTLIGAIGAGLFCSKFFPDDPQSWRRSARVR